MSSRKLEVLLIAAGSLSVYCLMNTREMLFVRHAITISEHNTLNSLLQIASRVLFVPPIDPLRRGSTSIHMDSLMKQRAR